MHQHVLRAVVGEISARVALDEVMPRMAPETEALIDELHLALRPVLLGSGEHLLGGIDMRALGYECTQHVAGERATHVFLRKRA